MQVSMGPESSTDTQDMPSSYMPLPAPHWNTFHLTSVALGEPQHQLRSLKRKGTVEGGSKLKADAHAS